MLKEETRNCQNCENDFVIELDDFSFYEKIKVPPPTFCPDCRMIRRMNWRNERSLFHRDCDFSGKKIISMFHPEAKVKVYDHGIWWSDKWDPTEYGQDYDFSRPFFEQFKKLLTRVPLANVGNTNCINSPYGNHNADCKNCYLVYASYLAEDVMYSQGAGYLKSCVDIYSIMKSESCYEDILSGTLYNTHFSYDSDESVGSWFLETCVNCNDCIGCMNLRSKRFCILNRQYNKEEYLKEKEKYDFGSYKILSNFKKEFGKFVSNFPHRYAGIIKSVNCTGDNILNSKNVKQSFDIYGDIEDSKYVAHGLGAKDSHDIYGFGAGAFLLYEGVDIGIRGSDNYFCVLNHGSISTQYTYMCYNAKNLFGCIGIRKGEYCILNKKYTKEEYYELVPKIIKHMNEMPYVDKKGNIYKYGEFFPSELSPFTYNETIAHEYFPKTKDCILKEGYSYRLPQEKDYQITLENTDLPDHIKDVTLDILNETISCPNKGSDLTKCTFAYRIHPEELSFLRKHNITLPRYCPNCRHYERLAQRNPLKLWHRKCMCENESHHHEGGANCQNEFETSYSPDRQEIIYCESCYQREVY